MKYRAKNDLCGKDKLSRDAFRFRCMDHYTFVNFSLTKLNIFHS